MRKLAVDDGGVDDGKLEVRSWKKAVMVCWRPALELERHGSWRAHNTHSYISFNMTVFIHLLFLCDGIMSFSINDFRVDFSTKW